MPNRLSRTNVDAAVPTCRPLTHCGAARRSRLWLRSRIWWRATNRTPNNRCGPSRCWLRKMRKHCNTCLRRSRLIELKRVRAIQTKSASRVCGRCIHLISTRMQTFPEVIPPLACVSSPRLPRAVVALAAKGSLAAISHRCRPHATRAMHRTTHRAIAPPLGAAVDSPHVRQRRHS